VSSTKCPLDCQNGGECRWGEIEKKSKNSTEEEGSKSSNSKPSCSCPRGFIGTHCEIALRLCPTENDESHHILAGRCFSEQPCARALDSSGKVYTHCECDPYTTDMTDAAVHGYCQSISTVYCEMPTSSVVVPSALTATAGKAAAKAAEVASKSSTSFCTNGGKCRTEATTMSKTSKNYATARPHLGCDCPQGYTGEYCEIPLTLLSRSSLSQPGMTRAKIIRGIEITISLTCIVILFGMIGFFVYHGMVDQGHRRITRYPTSRRRAPTRKQYRGRIRRAEQEMTPVSTRINDSDEEDSDNSSVSE
jgi:hypothetical protein